jgi:hypothetical protein
MAISTCESGRVGDEQPQLHSIRQQPQPFARSEQHSLGNAQMAVAIRGPAPGRCIQIFVKLDGPHAQLGAAISREQQRAAGFLAFARLDGIGRFEPGVAQRFGERVNDAVAHPERAATRDQLA